MRPLTSAIAGTLGAALLVWLAVRGLRFSLGFAILVLIVAAGWMVRSLARFASAWRHFRDPDDEVPSRHR